MSHPTSCMNLPNVTFSPVLVSGPMLCVWPDGRITDKSGREVVRASLSARLVKALGLTMSGTFGPTSSISSESVNLSMSLANRLRQVTRMNGSTLFNQTWKEWVTPLGLRRSRLRASVRRTSESALTGWPTPLASNIKNCYQDWLKVIARQQAGRQPNLQDFAVLTGWPTPTTEASIREKRYAQGGMPFSMAAALTGWVTPTSRDWKDSAGMTAQRDGKNRIDQLPRQAFLMGWPTPRAVDGEKGSRSIQGCTSEMKRKGRLDDLPSMAVWSTSSTPLRLTVFGEMRIGSYVEMENGVQLNPSHSRWLMGLPRAWDESSPGWPEWQAATELDV